MTPPETAPAPEPPCALVVDDEKFALGELALRILRLGVDVFHAKGGGEATLLAREAAERIRALLFPPALSLAELASLTACLSSREDPSPVTLVVVGEKPEDARRADLREAGVDWALWEPFEESALRQVLAQALTAWRDVEMRKEPRVPTTILARAFAGIKRKDVLVSTLSTAGAFLETPFPFHDGTRISLEMALPDGCLVTKADVVFARSSADTGGTGQPAGMGVAFSGLDAGSERALRPDGCRTSS